MSRGTDWNQIDWRKSNSEIVAETGRALTYVQFRRRRHAPETAKALLPESRRRAGASAVARWAVRGKKWKDQSATIQRMARTMLAKGESNEHARPFSLRSPDGRIFRGANVRLFVRAHESLFRSSDLNWDAKAPRAVDGLYRILSGRLAAWKGWTAVQGDENL